MRLLTLAAVVVAALIGIAAMVAAAAALVADERTVRATVEEPVRAVVLDLDQGDVQVRGTDADTVSFERRERSSLARPQVDQELRDGVLRITARCEDAPGPCSVDIALQVPAGTDVRVRSTSGDVDLDRLEAGEVDVESDAGDVAARGLRATRARMRSDAGDVELAGAQVRTLAVTTNAGDVEAEEVRADRLEVRTDAGDVDLAVPAGRYAVDADTRAGDVDVDVAQDPRASRVLRVTTGAGDVTIAAD